MIKVRELSNGIQVVMEQMDYLHTVSFGAWVRVGSAFESVETNGMSHMLEHMAFKGTQTRTARQLADEMAVIGGNMNACTCKEYTAYYVTTLNEYLKQAVTIIGDMLLHSRFDEDDFRREKGVVLEEIMMYEDSPEDLVHEMIQKMVWRDHPLGYVVSGSLKGVDLFSREKLVDFYRTHYVAENTILSVSGKFSEEELIAICEEAFGGMPRGDNRFYLTTPPYVRSFYKEEKDIEQIHLNLAFPGVTINSEQKYALLVASEVLGGSDNSRLFQMIREDMGKAYSIFSYLSPFLRAGLSHVDVVLTPNNLVEVLDGVRNVLMEYRVSGMSQEELVRTKEQLKVALLISEESTRGRMESNAKAMLYRGEPIPLSEVVCRIEAVDQEAVIQSIQQYFNLDEMSISLVGNIKVPEIGYVESFVPVTKKPKKSRSKKADKEEKE